jgi:glycosyltransferase involved in cell wall biosynthesis
VTHWHIITGEYPPHHGGVSDYTRRAALGLAAAGDEVDVWAPPAHQAECGDSGITVHRLPDRFGLRSLRLMTRELDKMPAPRRILVQYVPHAFGLKAANVPFCLWLRSRRRDSVWVMFHEVAFPFDRRGSVARNALAAVNRLMASLVASATERAFVSIPGWEQEVQAMLGPGKPVEWLPVPSAIPVVTDVRASAAIRADYAGGRTLVGHFGTHGDAIRALLMASLPLLAGAADCHVLLVGRRGDEFLRDLLLRHPGLKGRVHATGVLTDEAVSRHVGACDVMLQPYPDGVSSRRTSAMTALSHGVPMVTTSGWLTEPLWRESDAAVLVPVDGGALAAAAARLLSSPLERSRLAVRARALYTSRFDIAHTIAGLRAADSGSRELAMVPA